MQLDVSIADIITAGRNARRNKDMSDPDALLSVFLDYLEVMHGRCWQKSEVLKSGDLAGTIVDVCLTAPLTYQTFTTFSGATEERLKELRSDARMSEVATIICSAIDGQQLEGAAVGAFNAQLIQRLQGLADKQDPDALTGVVKQIVGLTVV